MTRYFLIFILIFGLSGCYSKQFLDETVKMAQDTLNVSKETSDVLYPDYVNDSIPQTTITIHQEEPIIIESIPHPFNKDIAKILDTFYQYNDDTVYFNVLNDSYEFTNKSKSESLLSLLGYAYKFNKYDFSQYEFYNICDLIAIKEYNLSNVECDTVVYTCYCDVIKENKCVKEIKTEHSSKCLQYEYNNGEPKYYSTLKLDFEVD